MIDVSVVIPTYNAGKPLIDAIESILHQQGVNKQILVIEDGSSSPSIDIIKEHFFNYLEPENTEKTASIKYIQKVNTGAYHARLSAIEQCDGNYIKFLDQDDILLKQTLVNEVNAFETDIDVVLSNWLISEQTENKDTVTKKNAPILNNPIDDFLASGGVFTSAALYRAATVRKSLIPITTFTPIKADDWLIFAQVCLGGAKYKTIDNIAYIWNQNAEQLSVSSRSKLISEHYNILNWIESKLRDSDSLTVNRKKLLANYYAKQLIEAYEKHNEYFVMLIEKIKSLQPEYQQQHGNRLYKIFCRILGLKLGVKFYSSLKNFLLTK